VHLPSIIGRVSRSVKVTVAGTRLAIRTDAKPKYIRELAAYVTEKIDEIKATGKTATTQSLALMAAMSIADELHELREEQRQLKRRVREKTNRILNYLEQEVR